MKQQILPFLLVGSAAALVHTSVVALLVQFGRLPPLLANVAGFGLAFFVSFAGHARWTFPTPASERTAARQRFFTLALLGFALNQGCYAAALAVLGPRWYLYALAAVQIGVAAATFALSRLWAFAPTGGSGGPRTRHLP